MNRDQLLAGLVGLVLGFVLAYPVFEAMSVRQPALRVPGEGGEEGQGAAAMPGAGGGAGAPAGAPVAEVQRLRQRLERDPNDIEALQQLIGMNFQIGELERARDLLERYVTLRPDDARALLVLADLEFQAQDYAPARDHYERYLTLAPPDAEVLTDLGAAYRYLREPEKALELLERAEQLDPSHWAALYYQVVVHGFDLGNPRRAREILTRLQAMQPENPDVRNLSQQLDRQLDAAG